MNYTEMKPILSDWFAELDRQSKIEPFERKERTIDKKYWVDKNNNPLFPMNCSYCNEPLTSSDHLSTCLDITIDMHDKCYDNKRSELDRIYLTGTPLETKIGDDFPKL